MHMNIREEHILPNVNKIDRNTSEKEETLEDIEGSENENESEN